MHNAKNSFRRADSDDSLKASRKELAISAPSTPQPIKRIHVDDRQPKRRKSQSEIKKPASPDQPASLQFHATMGTPRGSGHFQFFISSTVPVRPTNEKEFTVSLINYFKSSFIIYINCRRFFFKN